jgi:hypothetical protein
LDELAAVVARQTLDLNVYAGFLLRDDHVVTPPSMVVPLS